MIAAATKSEQKHGTIVNEGGFVQHARTVEDYLNSLGCLCSSEILLITILESYRWSAEQEIFPSVKTLAQRCNNVQPRRINQMTRHLEQIGLIKKVERFAGKSQLSNYYDLEPLFEKVAAWKDEHVAAELEQEEAQADQPFTPENVLEEVTQVISEEYGEPEPRQIRYNVRRLTRRWNDAQHLDWPDFEGIIRKAAEQTDARKEQPTNTGKTFTKLVAYFFSALDYWLSKSQAPAPAPTSQAQHYTTSADQVDEALTSAMAASSKGQNPPKTGILAERARKRREAEQAGRPKVRADEHLARIIGAASLAFNDEQVKSSVQRAANLMHDAQVDELTMYEKINEARGEASEATTIKTRNRHGSINRMPYFFQRLEEKLNTWIGDSVQ